MHLSPRASEVRAAMEAAAATVARVEQTRPGRVRISVPAPHARSEVWEALLVAIRRGSRYGTSDAHGAPIVWAEVYDEEGQRAQTPATPGPGQAAAVGSDHRPVDVAPVPRRSAPPVPGQFGVASRRRPGSAG